MVGSGGSGSDRSKEAVGMMALHEALRSVCINSDWTYSVFWTIRPRPRLRGGNNGCKVGDDNGSLMLMWEDGFCRGRASESLEDMNNGEEDPVRKAFSKMSIQLYNYGEGLMGKVASDKCHKWVFKEPSESEPNTSNYWPSSFDAVPSEWIDQFESGIQTIAVIQAGHGLLQLGSCKIIAEDLHFVLRMRHTFESLGYQSGFYLSHLFSSTRNPSSSTSTTVTAIHPPSPLINWPHHHHHRPPLLSSATTSMNLSSPVNFHNSSTLLGLNSTIPHHQPKDQTHLFLHNYHPSSDQPPPPVIGRLHGNDDDLKWQNGLSFFDADGAAAATTNTASEFHESDMDKFKRSFALPSSTIMALSSSSSSSAAAASLMDRHRHQQQPVDYYRKSEGGPYQDVM
ncbi:hypothetical protein K1719_032057 [Acacia pycnantha]|nr:hypothetical protein K1719_032057 [Acacia pycnantha]